MRAMGCSLYAPCNSKRRRVEKFIRCDHPKEGWVQLNTDGASKGNPSRVRAGGLIRGHMGELYEVFATVCGSCSCTKAELMGVLGV